MHPILSTHLFVNVKRKLISEKETQVGKKRLAQLKRGGLLSLGGGTKFEKCIYKYPLLY